MNDFYKHVVMKMPYAYARHKLLLDVSKKPVDSVFLDMNEAFVQIFNTNRDRLIGESLSSVEPAIRNLHSDFIGHLNIQDSSDLPVSFTACNEESMRHYQITAFRIADNEVVTIFDDITSQMESRNKLLEANTTLIEHNRRLYNEAVTDSLTSFYNHNYIREILKEEIELAQYHQIPLSVAMLDIDHFKLINDTYGHLAGDSILVRLSELIRKHVRSIDHVGRYGGEEFLLILPETDIVQAAAIVDRLRKTICEYRFAFDGHPITITVSCGLSSHSGQGLHLLIEEADRHLYEAKRLGRNQCQCEMMKSG